MPIKCCKDCVPPKRHPGCHSQCPDYLREKAEHEEWKKKKGLQGCQLILCPIMSTMKLLMLGAKDINAIEITNFPVVHTCAG